VCQAAYNSYTTSQGLPAATVWKMQRTTFTKKPMNIEPLDR
jgi:hypothetical protein